MKLCRKCGSLSFDDVVFCYICGTKFLDCDEKESSDKSKKYDDCYEATCPACNDTFEINEKTLHSGSMKCPNCGEEIELDVEYNDQHYFSQNETEDYDGTRYEITCPACNDTFEINEETLHSGSIKCPNCGEKMEFEFESDY